MSSKILISWVALQNDFYNDKSGAKKANPEGPSLTFHRQFYDHDCHYLLSSAKEEDTQVEWLVNMIRRDFPDHKTELVYMDINDVIDLQEVESKVRTFLLKFKEYEIDIFFSPGTSIMQLSWFLCHTSMGLKTRLIQTRSPEKSKDGTPELLYLDLDPSSTSLSLALKNQKYEREPSEDFYFFPSLNPVYKLAEKAAWPRNAPVLIQGETGTGKELLARYIHKNSPRENHPLLTLNCSAFSDNLLETRLFGYKKGAFTDAKKDQKGLFKEADGGTLFLDEIGDISPYMQQSLLRVVQEGEILPVGANNPEKVDVRIIAATHQDLLQLAKEGKFRWDLYYRLSVAELSLPPVRELKSDEKEKLLRHFLKQKQKELHANTKITINSAAWNMIMQYPFPGNIREMENMIETLYIFCDNEAGPGDLPGRIHKQKEHHASLVLDDVIKEHVLYVNNLCNHNYTETSRILGISYNNLKEKLKQYGVYEKGKAGKNSI